MWFFIDYFINGLEGIKNFLKDIDQPFKAIKENKNNLIKRKKYQFVSLILDIIDPLDDIFDLYNYFLKIRKKEPLDGRMNGLNQIFASSFDFYYISVENQECRQKLCFFCENCKSFTNSFTKTKLYNVPNYKCQSKVLANCNMCNSCQYGKLHAEMKILVHLIDNEMDKKSSFIATSKLCCASCNLQIKSVNETRPNDLRFNVSGSHGKIYSGWVVPTFSRKELLNTLDFSFQRESSSFSLLEEEREIMIERWFK